MMIIIGEMQLVEGVVRVAGSVAYCDLRPWILSSTVKVISTLSYLNSFILSYLLIASHLIPYYCTIHFIAILLLLCLTRSRHFILLMISLTNLVSLFLIGEYSVW